MSTLQYYLQEYQKDHQNPFNQRLHKICVPLIFWSMLSFLWPWHWFGLRLFSYAFLPLAIFYARLGNWSYFIFLVYYSAFYGINLTLTSWGIPIGWLSATVFILAWLGQFYGHYLEGKRPSFLRDVKFLLIGPLWVVKKTH